MTFQKGHLAYTGFRGKKHTSESRMKMSKSLTGRTPWNKKEPIKLICKWCSKEFKVRPSRAHNNTYAKAAQFCSYTCRSKYIHTGRITKESTKKKIGCANKGKRCGEESIHWKGGEKLRNARAQYKRRGRGFILVTKRNIYNEPIEYHHIHSDLPYVVPCPKRLHQMFKDGSHFNNVNAMLGIVSVENPDIFLFKLWIFEGDVL